MQNRYGIDTFSHCNKHELWLLFDPISPNSPFVRIGKEHTQATTINVTKNLAHQCNYIPTYQASMKSKLRIAH
jgi:hypothetical protein